MKHTWSQSELDFVSQKRQRAKWYLAVHKPRTIAAMQIRGLPNNHPVSAIEVELLSAPLEAVTSGLTVWLGSTDGGSDLGKVRVRRDMVMSYATPITMTPPGTTGLLPVMESGSGLINWKEVGYVTVKEERRPWVRHPRYDTAASKWRMDYDQEHTGQLEAYPPLTLMGAPFCGIMNGSTISASFVGSDSWEGDASIASVQWKFPDGQSASSLGYPADPIIKTFTAASPDGRYYSLALSSTISTSHVGYRLAFVFENEADVPRVAFSEIAGGIESGGYRTQITAYNVGEEDIPKGAEVIIFEAASYGNTACAMGGNAHFRNNIVFRGWVTDEMIMRNPQNGMVTFAAETIDGLLKNTPSYDTFFTKNDHVDDYHGEWIETQSLSIDRAALNLLKWRSSVTDIVDFNRAEGLAESTVILYQDLPKGTLWQQLVSNYKDRGILFDIASDMQSNLHAFDDPNIHGSSGNYYIMPTLSASNTGGTMQIERVFHDQAAMVKLYAVASVTPLGAESPGTLMGYAGGQVEQTQGLAVNSQDQLITWAGNLRAKRNAEFKRVTVPLAGNMRIDAVPRSIVPVTIASDKNARKLSWNSKLFIPNETNVVYNQGRGTLTNLIMEEVVNGIGGSAITFPPIVKLPPPTPDDNTPPPGPSVGSDVVYVMGESVLGRTREFGKANPTWDWNLGPDEFLYYDFILDPWNPVNIGYLSTSNGLYKTEDLNSYRPTWSLVLSKASIDSLFGAYAEGFKISASINREGYVAYFFSAGGNVICAYSYDRFASWSYATVASGAEFHGSADYLPHLVGGEIVLGCAVVKYQGSPPSTKVEFYRSANGGASFFKVSDIAPYTADPVGDKAFYGTTLHYPYSNNQSGANVYYADSGGTGGLYKSSNGGLTWSKIASDLTSPDLFIHRHMAETYTLNINQVHYWNSSTQLRVSTNGGASFETRGATGGDLKAAGGFPFDNGRFYVVTSTGIFVSTDNGNTFYNKTNNYPVSELATTGYNRRAIIVPVWVE
jgi:hypothetical protein